MIVSRRNAPSWYIVTIISSLGLLIKAQSATYPVVESPCPSIFEYEPPGSDDDRWYGVVKLNSDVDLHGIWIDIVLDKKADLVGNWFGDVSTKDNTEFKIENKNEVVRAGTTKTVRFFVKFGLSIPRVKLFRLNGRQICSAGRENTLQSRNPPASQTTQRSTNTMHRKETAQDRGNIVHSVNKVDEVQAGTTYDRNNDRNTSPYSNKAENDRSLNYGSNTGSSRPTVRTSYDRNNDRDTNSGDINNRQSNSYSGSSRTSITQTGASYDRNNNRDPSSNTNRPDANNRQSSSSTFGSNIDSNRQSDVQSGTQHDRNNNRNTLNILDINSVNAADTTRNAGSRRPTTDIQTGNQYNRNNNRNTLTTSSAHRNDAGTRSSNTNRPNTGSGRPLAVWPDYDYDNDKKGPPSSEEDYFLGDLHPGSKLPNNNEECGKVVPSSISLIAYGTATTEGQYPWHVAIYRMKYVDSTYICGGNLVSRDYVITAAHCVTRTSTKLPINKNILTLHFGKYNLRLSVKGVQLKFVSQIIVNPNYPESTVGNDIAILRLRSPVEITDHVRPVCLWPDDLANISNVVDKTGAVVGWGFDEDGHVTEDLRLAQMPVIDELKCIRSYGEFYAKYTTDTTFCAGYLNGTSVCNGDSGGGMVFPLGTTQNPTWHLRGLVSVGAALQNKGRCDTSHYIIFTDVAKFNSWIRSVIQSRK